jgi:tripartite-type tricarboxylate transporter receptor subunit TctC
MGHNGAGSSALLTCVFYFQRVAAEPTYVVYRGFGQTINDILSGSIDGTCELIASARE